MAALVTQRRIGLGECDRSGFAYFPSYIAMLASVVEEMFGRIGLPYSILMGKLAIGVPTVRLEVTFERPGFLDDVLDWRLVVARVGTTSAELQHAVASRGRPLWVARQVLVAVSLEGYQPVALSSEMRAGLARFMETGNAQGPAA
jgi:4-hydroxybenzoyl-CoA thioesterase